MCTTIYSYFFFNDPATTEIYTFPYTTLFRSIRERTPTTSCGFLSKQRVRQPFDEPRDRRKLADEQQTGARVDRKSTRLNSSHVEISYAVFCLKKKKKKKK